MTTQTTSPEASTAPARYSHLATAADLAVLDRVSVRLQASGASWRPSPEQARGLVRLARALRYGGHTRTE